MRWECRSTVGRAAGRPPQLDRPRSVSVLLTSRRREAKAGSWGHALFALCRFATQTTTRSGFFFVRAHISQGRDAAAGDVMAMKANVWSPTLTEEWWGLRMRTWW